MSEVSNDQEPQVQENSFRYYTQLLEDINNQFPQHQGLDHDEFVAALGNPDVKTTVIEDGPDKRVLPQLEPVGAFEWLYSPYYKAHFPDEFDDGRLMHFSDLPGVTPGEEVQTGLRDLADKEGVLVFDYPSADTEYPDRVKQLLDGLEIDVEELPTLGTQAYYAGEMTPKRPMPERDHPLDYVEASQLLLAAGEDYDESARVKGVYVEQEITGEEAEVMYGFYKDAYATISDHPCTQGLDPEEFRAMLADPEVAKTVYRNGNLAETLLLSTNRLDDLTWVNTDFYRHLAPEKFAKGQVVWFPGFATNPDPAVTGHNTPEIVSFLTRLNEYGDNPLLVVFDLPDINQDFLDVYLEQSVNEAPYMNIKFQKLGFQRYVALRVKSRDPSEQD